MSDLVERVAGEQQRNIAVDAYRGLVMLLMMGEVLRFAHAAAAYPDSVVWRILAYNQTHVEWAGMSLHDMIQPSFTFLVGVALPYSLRSRQRKGESFRRMLAHTIWRSFILIALGIFLRSTYSPMTNYTFEDTLTQIGLGYTFAFLLTFVRPRWQWISFAAILFGYWLAWALYPAPGANFDWAAVGVPPEFHRASVFGICGALEQEQQSRPGIRLVVSECVAAAEPFSFQRRRLSDAEFYSHAGHDADGFGGRALVSWRRRRRFRFANSCWQRWGFARRDCCCTSRGFARS